jgi:hypothetical protein
MIENYIPDWKGVPSRNPDFRHLTYDQAHVLSSKKVRAADEMTGLNDPFIRQNFMKMLHKITSEESGTPEGLHLMDELKVNAP